MSKRCATSLVSRGLLLLLTAAWGAACDDGNSASDAAAGADASGVTAAGSASAPGSGTGSNAVSPGGATAEPSGAGATSGAPTGSTATPGAGSVSDGVSPGAGGAGGGSNAPDGTGGGLGSAGGAANADGDDPTDPDATDDAATDDAALDDPTSEESGLDDVASPDDAAADDEAPALEDAGASSDDPSGAQEAGAEPEPAQYQPCPPTGPCKIMPFGDSITEGCCNFQGGYRVDLFRFARADGHEITFVGSVSNGPAMVDGVAFPQDHEGHGGYTIESVPARNANGIAPFVATSLPAYEPHIITLMIGTNDLNGNIDVASAPARLGALLDSIFETDPDVLVVLAQIVPTTNDGTNQVVQTYNAAIPALVDEQLAQGRHVVLVDMYGAFTRDADYKTSLMADGLHPGNAGYTRMAETWYEALEPYLR